MDAIARIAEQKILEAQRDGWFNNLPGRGEPLALGDDRHVPAELRVGYKILKNAGMLPPELELRREIVSLEALLRCCEDEAEAANGRRRLALLRLRFETAMQRQGVNLSAAYGAKVYDRLG